MQGEILRRTTAPLFQAEPGYRMITHSSPIPLYHQIASVLRQRILDGTYPAHHQLAPEQDLAREFGVSRATVRQALLDLVESGLLARQHGRGTFVLDVARKTMRYVFKGDMNDLLTAASSNAHAVREISILHRRRLPEEVAAELGLPEGRGTIVERLMFAGEAPFAFHRNFLCDAHGKLLTKRGLKSAGILHILQQAGVHLTSARQSILARPADLDIGEKLGIGRGGVVLQTQRTARLATGAAAEVSHSWYPADMYGYTVEFSV
ncbi:GntR family transcriptional regulator [Streptomyces noursei]